MSDDQFNFKNTSFWGALAGFFWALRAYFKYRSEMIENNKQNKESKMKDIKNVMEILDFGFAARQVLMDMFKDGKFHFESVGELMPLYPKASAALDSAGEVPSELADLDANEATQLVSFVVNKGVADAHAADIISKSLNVGVSVIELIKAIKA